MRERRGGLVERHRRIRQAPEGGAVRVLPLLHRGARNRAAVVGGERQGRQHRTRIAGARRAVQPAARDVRVALVHEERACRRSRPRTPAPPRGSSRRRCLRPRLLISYTRTPLPLVMSTGLRMSTSKVYSTRPSALRGAFSRSTIPAFSGAPGSATAVAVPSRISYARPRPERPAAERRLAAGDVEPVTRDGASSGDPGSFCSAAACNPLNPIPSTTSTRGVGTASITSSRS